MKDESGAYLRCHARRILLSVKRTGRPWGDKVDEKISSITIAGELAQVWQQARENHERYSATGDTEQDIRFFALGLAGEAGEVANFVKKRWRDGDLHHDDLRAECADMFAYNIMLADALGMSPSDLLAVVALKQQVFLAKMAARDQARIDNALGEE